MPSTPHAEPFTPWRDGERDATVFRCALCGGRFSHGGRACAPCPLSSGCDLVRCPSCGYTFPRTSRLWAWLRRRLDGWSNGRPR
jgi:uncharacterized C2H2 Zn-finger protein